MPKPICSVIGLGKLGSPIVATVAERGFQVIGADINQKFVDAINRGEAPVLEPDLDAMLKRNKERISASEDIEDAVFRSDITMVIVPTPSEESGEFSTAYVKEAAKPIARALARKDTFHLVVLTSTVLPGASERDIIPELESLSGKKCGVDFGYCYNPEFIALGSVIRNLLNPDFLLIGESDQKSGGILEDFYKEYTLNSAPVRRMRIVNAEITKISINTYVTSKISFANMVAQLCDRIPGGDVDQVTDAIGMDKRIGLKYLKGGVGYGGPCFPRDNRALARVYAKFGLNHAIAKATDDINHSHAEFIAAKIESLLPQKGSVAILGAAYKPDTPVVEESQNLVVARKLIERGFSVTCYDPAASLNAVNVLPDASYAQSLEDCVRGKDLICLMTVWDEFKTIPPEIFGDAKPFFLDCWRVIDDKSIISKVNYFQLGVNA